MNDNGSFIFVIKQSPVSSNRYWRHTKQGKVYISAEALLWRKAVALSANLAGVQLLLGAVRLTIEYRHQHRKRRLDVSNVIKILEDGLKGVAFEDDKQVTQLIATAIHDKDDPRVVVRIESAGASDGDGGEGSG
jgi:crossover junction endodeoxyribonuclease RusA